MINNNSDIDSSSNSNSNSITIDNPIQQYTSNTSSHHNSYSNVDISTAKDKTFANSSPRLSDLSNNSISSSGTGSSSSSGVSIKSFRIDDDVRYIISISL